MGVVTSERARAYGRVVKTIDNLAAAKLQPYEVASIREAADTLLFSEDISAPGAREALAEVEALATHLVDSDRWTDDRARRLVDDVVACGPLAPVA